MSSVNTPVNLTVAGVLQFTNYVDVASYNVGVDTTSPETGFLTAIIFPMATGYVQLLINNQVVDTKQVLSDEIGLELVMRGCVNKNDVIRVNAPNGSYIDGMFIRKAEVVAPSVP